MADTVPIAFNAAMTTQIKSAIEGLETFYGGTITSISQNGAGNDQNVTIAFAANMGDVADITISPSVSWPGTASVINTEIVKGRPMMTGDFTVFYGPEETRRLSHDESALGMSQALENLEGIGEVAVKRNDLGSGSYEWIVTFLTEMGNLPLMTTTSGRLLASRPFARVAEVQSGTEGEMVYNEQRILIPKNLYRKI